MPGLRTYQTGGYDPITGVPTMGTQPAAATEGDVSGTPYFKLSGGGTTTIPATSVATPPPNLNLPGFTGNTTPPPASTATPGGNWNLEMPPPAAAPSATTGAAPSGGNLHDPTYVASLVAYYGAQPGADPSLKNDPEYWIQKITSGELGTDEGYIVGKMQNAWKAAPESTTDPNAIDPALAALVARGGSSPYGSDIETIVKNLIASGGVRPDTTGDLINARETEAQAEQGQLADANAQLAEAGAMGEPGVAQGPQIGAIERVQQNVAPAYAQSVRDIETHASDTQHASLMSALQLATGMGEADANNIIQAIGTGTQGKVALATIALDQLRESDDWNKFLANYGLDQAKLQNDINNGNWDHAIALLTLYVQGGGVVSGGHY